MTSPSLNLFLQGTFDLELCMEDLLHLLRVGRKEFDEEAGGEPVSPRTVFIDSAP
jgi:hypothetical protein